MKRRIFAYVLLIIGGLLCTDTIVLLIKTASRSLGIFMPLCLGLPLCAAGLAECFRPSFLKGLIGKLLRLLLVLGYAVFCTAFSVTTLLAFSAGHAVPDNGADVLIVLGCGVQGDRVTLTLANRLDRAVEYLGENPHTTVIVSGGQGAHENISEAEAMHGYLIAHGIDKERIIMEDKSTSTEENFAFSKKIIDELYPDGAKVVFVTTYFHVYRAGRVAQKAGLQAQGIGAKGVWYITFNDYLRECVGIIMYTLKGKI